MANCCDPCMTLTVSPKDVCFKPIRGATVYLVDVGGTVYGPLVNLSSDSVAFNLKFAGTYTIAMIAPSGSLLAYGSQTGTQAVTCNFNLNKDLAFPSNPGYATGCCLCLGSVIPITAYMDDSFGTVAMTYSRSGGGWNGCAMRTAALSRNAACTLIQGSISVPVLFSAVCNPPNISTGAPGQWTLLATVPECTVDGRARDGFSCSDSFSGSGGGGVTTSFTCAPLSVSVTGTNANNHAAFQVYGASTTLHFYQ